VNIYYRERQFSAERRSLQHHRRSRVIHLLGSSRGHGGRVQGRRRRIGVAERRFYYTGRLRGGSSYARTRAYTRARVRAIVWRTVARRTAGEAVSARHNPNSKPVPAPRVNNNNILLHPAPLSAVPPPTWPPRSGATTRCI